MSKTFIKCLREEDWSDVKDGLWHGDKVRVFCGFNNYADIPDHINELIEVIRYEFGGISTSDMHIHFVTPSESIRHARFTMIQVAVDTVVVRKHIWDYRIL